MNQRKMSLRTKIIILVSVLMLATNLALGLVLARQARNTTKKRLNEHMLDIVGSAAAMLDGDEIEHLTARDRWTA